MQFSTVITKFIFFTLVVTLFSCGTKHVKIENSLKANNNTESYNILTHKVNDDFVLGQESAKVSIIEYSSFSCFYCQKFNQDILPKIKQNYISTGKVKFVHKDFPLEVQSLYGAVVTRCLGAENYYPAVENLFSNTQNWILSDGSHFLKNLHSEVSKFGLEDEKEFKKCLNNKNIGQKILDDRKLATEKLKIVSTPTIFINNIKIVGYIEYDEIKKIIDQELEEVKND